MAVADSDVLQAAARLEYEGVEDVVGVYQFRKDDAGSIGDTPAIDDILEFLEDIYTFLAVVIPVLTLFRDITIRNLTQAVLMGTFSWPTLTAGSGSGSAVPPGVAGMASFPTAIPRVILRKYWLPYTTTNMESDGTLSSGALTAQTSAAALLLTTFAATNAEWDYGYLSPKTGTFVLPTSALITDIPAYQRRRKQGRGV